MTDAGSTSPTRLRIGDMLVQAGALTQAKLDEALAFQKAHGTGRRLGELLVERGFVPEAVLVQILGNQLSVPWVNLHHVDFSRQLLSLVPGDIAAKHKLVPVYVRNVRRQGDVLYVAMDDPTNEDAMLAVAAASQLPVKAMIAALSEIRSVLRAYYGITLPDPSAPAPFLPAARVAAASEGRASTPPNPEGRISTPPIQPPAAPSPEPPRAEKLALGTAQPPEVRSGAPTSDPPGKAFSPPKELEAVADPVMLNRPKKPKMVTLTLLDGTKVTLPAPGKKSTAKLADEDALTAHDLIAALRAHSHGADVSDVLGDVRWEILFSALLSLLMKKHLIADWEFVEELKKQTNG